MLLNVLARVFYTSTLVHSQVRQDVRVARMTQEELEQDAALKELEQKKRREDEDARMAAEMHR